VCKAAPVPGETKVWQYIALTRKLYLLDCPGIVPPSASDFDADCAKVLKGVVRAERLKTPSDYIHEVLLRVKKPYLLQRYRLPADTTWNDSEEFLTILGKKMGKLVKGGDADIDTAARIVLYDWQRGRIPYFTAPPEIQEEKETPEKDARLAEGASEAAAEGEDLSIPSAAQSLNGLSEIPCVHVFDEEDRRGEATPAPDKASSSTPSQSFAVNDEEQEAPKKKRRRKTRGNGRPSTRSDGVAPEPGTLDWKAVVAEFGI
ncbi:Nuclear/nucleolar GTPase 2 (OsNug2), partial [Durusdinium trenchii]